MNFISSTSQIIRALSTLQHVITWIHSLLSGDFQTSFKCPYIDTMLTSQQFIFPVQNLPLIFHNRFLVVRAVPSVCWILICRNHHTTFPHFTILQHRTSYQTQFPSHLQIYRLIIKIIQLIPILTLKIWSNPFTLSRVKQYIHFTISTNILGFTQYYVQCYVQLFITIIIKFFYSSVAYPRLLLSST
jgi:hypothetical protein